MGNTPATAPGMPPDSAAHPPLRQVAGFFLKLGTIAFGGPAAHIAMMEDELVGRRKWIAAADFLDLLAVANLIPGPSSTELAIFIGYRLRGIRGLLLAGVCFILPAFLMVGAIAWAYQRYGALPAVAGLLYGIKPVVIAIVIQALWRLAKSAVKNRWLAALGIAALIACFVGANPALVLLAAGVVAATVYRLRAGAGTLPMLAVTMPATSAAATVSAFSAVTLPGIFLIFLKIGCIVFGSGYVLLAFLRAELVDGRHWLTESQLLDAVAVGQVTPGPVFTTATFIGYLLSGPWGAVVATLGIFAPAFLLVAIAGPLIPRLRRSKLAAAALDGLNVASLALMANVAWQLARAAIIGWPTAVIALVCAILLLRFKLNSIWFIAAGAGIGLAAHIR